MADKKPVDITDYLTTNLFDLMKEQVGREPGVYSPLRRLRSKGLIQGNPVLEPPSTAKINSLNQVQGNSANSVSDYIQGKAEVKDGRAQVDSFTLRLPPSSTIQTATYYPDKDYLTVSFKSGGQYSYQDVPMEVVGAWMRASSAGSHFYYNIRTSFRYQKV